MSIFNPLNILYMRILLSVFALSLFLISCSSEKKNEEEKNKDEGVEVNNNNVKEPFKDLQVKKFYEGIRKEGTDKLYKFRVDSVGPDGITMYNVSLFGEEAETSGLAMSATSDSAMIYVLGDKLVIELFEGVANFFNSDQLTKTESFIKKDYRFDMKGIKVVVKGLDARKSE